MGAAGAVWLGPRHDMLPLRYLGRGPGLCMLAALGELCCLCPGQFSTCESRVFAVLSFGVLAGFVRPLCGRSKVVTDAVQAKALHCNASVNACAYHHKKHCDIRSCPFMDSFALNTFRALLSACAMH